MTEIKLNPIWVDTEEKEEWENYLDYFVSAVEERRWVEAFQILKEMEGKIMEKIYYSAIKDAIEEMSDD